MQIQYIGSDLPRDLDIIKIDRELRRALAGAAMVMSGRSPVELDGPVSVEIDYKPLWSLLKEITNGGHTLGQHLRIEQTRVLVVSALGARDA